MSSFLPYGRQTIDDQDMEAVIQVLKSNWLTTGPAVEQFELDVTRYVKQEHGVALSSGTAALHTLLASLGVQPGDEVIVPAMTFVATANAVVFMGAVPIIADVEPDTLLLDPGSVEAKITSKTRAILAVDFTGHPANYRALGELAKKHGIALLADSCHSIGAELEGGFVPGWVDAAVFSFHPVKHLTTGEGGMIVTNDGQLAAKARQFRQHGIERDYHHRARGAQWHYDMKSLGYNYRITDLQCALGSSQLKKLPLWLNRREQLASHYTTGLDHLDFITPLTVRENVRHAYHLYVVRVDFRGAGLTREALFETMVAEGIGINVHYIPVHLHTYYQENFHYRPEHCPVATAGYAEIVSLPLFPGMTPSDVERVCDALARWLN